MEKKGAHQNARSQSMEELTQRYKDELLQLYNRQNTGNAAGSRLPGGGRPPQPPRPQPPMPPQPPRPPRPLQPPEPPRPPQPPRPQPPMPPQPPTPPMPPRPQPPMPPMPPRPPMPPAPPQPPTPPRPPVLPQPPGPEPIEPPCPPLRPSPRMPVEEPEEPCWPPRGWERDGSAQVGERFEPVVPAFENRMPTEPMEPPARPPAAASRTPRMSVQTPPPEAWTEPESDQRPQPGPAFQQDTGGAAPIPGLPDDEETGYLRVEVKTGRGAVPVPGAHVTVSRLIDDNPVLYRIVESNEDGDTPLIPVPTPRQSLSESPGNSRPFATYNIRVQQDGFYAVQNVNVPVFSGVVAIQPVELVPFPENTDRENADNIIFESAPQDL